MSDKVRIIRGFTPALLLIIAGCAAPGPNLPEIESSGTATVYLNEEERKLLFRQPAETRSDGGFQALLVDLQERMDLASGRIDLTPADLERIPRYAFDYEQGGWEDRLIAIFERHLGPRLGR